MEILLLKNNIKSLNMNIQTIPLNKIIPSKDNYRSEIDETAIKELSESISKLGLLQPILIRTNGKPGMYEIVAGERRYRAALLAKLTTIDAEVREMDDDTAFEIRITENLQRKDVHPMDEAIAYKTYRDQKKIDIDELSAKFSKPKEYIAHRLSFNNLIPEMQKEFYSGKMLIGHALLFARLTETDQKWCLEGCKPRWGDTTSYESVKECQLKISRELFRDLSRASFNTHDATLVVKAGSCDTCPKRSGHNLLFNDVKEKDRCFDGACFHLKMVSDILAKLNSLVIDTPDMPIIKGYSDALPEVEKFIKEKKLKILREYNDYSDAKKTDKGAVKALCIAGADLGQYKFITLSKDKKKETTEKKVDKNSPAGIDEQIANLKRSLEAAKSEVEDKVLEKAQEKLFDLKPYREPDTTPLSAYEWAAIMAYVSKETYGDHNRKIESELKKIKVDGKLTGAFAEIEKMAKAGAPLKNFVLRIFIKELLCEYLDDSTENIGYAVIKIAEQYKGVNVQQIRQQLSADYLKQEQNINNKIKELQDKKKATPATKPSAKKVVKKK
jgi:ParB/RepB/Spo0J family partition protein